MGHDVFSIIIFQSTKSAKTEFSLRSFDHQTCLPCPHVISVNVKGFMIQIVFIMVDGTKIMVISRRFHGQSNDCWVMIMVLNSDNAGTNMIRGGIMSQKSTQVADWGIFGTCGSQSRNWVT